MPTKALEDTASPDTLAERPLSFPDNRLLIELCGEFDANLAQIEQLLGILITRRGNELVLHGEAQAADRAKGALESLYQRLEQKREVTPGDVAAAVRMGGEPLGPDPEDVTQLEMFHGDTVEIRTRKKVVEPRTPAQKQYVRNLYSHELVFGIGPAGTGKTYLAVAAAVSMFLDGHVDKIILSRPAVEAGERLGFLPGTEKEKMDPYMRPLYDALYDFLPGKQVEKLIEDKQIEIAPLAFMRGRTLANAYVVLDEAQNATAMQMKMFLTRLGEGSRMAVTGDRTQVDLPRGTPSGLLEAERILQGVKGIAFSKFMAADVVRHPLVARIITAYEAAADPNV